MPDLEYAHLCLPNSQHNTLVSDIFSDQMSQPLNKGGTNLDLMHGAAEDIEYDYYDYLKEYHDSDVPKIDGNFYTESISKFVDSSIFSISVSLAFSGAALLLKKLDISFLPKTLNGMSIGLGKNIVMSSCADDFKHYLASTRIYDSLKAIAPESVSRFITNEIAVTGLNILLNGIQDLKTYVLVENVDRSTAAELDMKSPVYPKRVFTTGFQRIVKDGFVSVSDCIDFIPNKWKYFAIDTVKGIGKELLFSGGQLHLIAMRNIAVTAAKYTGEHIYLNYCKEYADSYIEKYIPDYHHLDYLITKLSSALLPTALLTVANKVADHYINKK